MDKIIATICGIRDDAVCITWEDEEKSVSREAWLNQDALEQIQRLNLLHPNETIVLTKYNNETVIRPWDDVLDMDVEFENQYIGLLKMLGADTEDMENRVQYVIHKRKALNERQNH